MHRKQDAQHKLLQRDRTAGCISYG